MWTWWRTLARIALVAAALGSAFPALAKVDGPTVSWRIATFGTRRAATAMLHELKRYVEQETDGRFSLTIGYGSFGEAKEFLDLLKIGSIHGAMVQSGLSTDRLPLYTVLDLPFLPLAKLDVQRIVHDKVHQHPAILREFAVWNALPFMSALLPQYELAGKGRTPKEPADLKGVRIRAIGDLGRAFAKLGAAPTTIPAADMYLALDRGLVSATALPFYAIRSYKMQEVAKWMTTNLSVGSADFPLALNLQAWNELPPQYRTLLEEAREKAYVVQKRAIDEDQETAFEFLKTKLTPVEFSEAEVAKFRAAGGAPVWEEWVKAREEKGLAGRELLDLVLKAAEAAGAN